jgi:tetratricopeptide (TPR) repeat protein
MNTPPTAARTLFRTGICLLLVAGMALPGCRAARRTAEERPRLDVLRESEQAVARAELLNAQGLDMVALAEFERAIAINPRITNAYMGIAEIHQRQGNYGPAEVHYRRAAELEPGNFDAHYGQGLMLQLLERVTEAVRAYLRALQLRPTDFDANLNLATAYLQLGEPAAGLVYAQRAVNLQPNSGPARVNLGAIYAALGDHESAVIEYQQAAELIDLTPELLLNLANSLGHVERYAEMQNTIEQLISIAPTAIAYERLASALFRQGRFDEALTEFRRALEYDADHYPAWNGVGVTLLNRYLLSGKQDIESRNEALRALRRSLQIERRQPIVLDLVSRYG